MCSPRANLPCPMGIGHQACARMSRLIDPALRWPDGTRGKGHRDPVLDIGRGGPVARPLRTLPHAVRGLPALERGEHGNGEQVEDRRGGKRVTGNPDHGDGRRALAGSCPVRLGVAEQHRVAGPDSDALTARPPAPVTTAAV